MLQSSLQILHVCMVSWLCHCQKQSPRDVLIKKVFLIIWKNSQEYTCVRASFLIKLQASACNFIKKETLAQTLAHVFSCEFFKVFKNSFFYRTPTVAAPIFKIFKSTKRKHFLKNGSIWEKENNGYRIPAVSALLFLPENEEISVSVSISV